MVYPALLPLIRTHRLPVVDWTNAPADLNGLVRFAERQNLVSPLVPSHFNWPVHLSLKYFSSYYVLPDIRADSLNTTEYIYIDWVDIFIFVSKHTLFEWSIMAVAIQKL